MQSLEKHVKEVMRRVSNIENILKDANSKVSSVAFLTDRQFVLHCHYPHLRSSFRSLSRLWQFDLANSSSLFTCSNSAQSYKDQIPVNSLAAFHDHI